jgi:hypothetical protein
VRIRVATQLDEWPPSTSCARTARPRTPAVESRPGALRAVLRSATTLSLLADDDGAVRRLLVAELRGTQLQLSLLASRRTRARAASAERSSEDCSSAIPT